jgi:hypothetical protein
MYETFREEPQFLFSLFAAMIVFGVPSLTILIAFGMRTWRKHQATLMENQLKSEMIAAGMSADDIERILAAKARQS